MQLKKQAEIISKVQQSNNLERYLNERSEFYEKFDLFKANRFKNILNLDFKAKVVQIIGTNGKGSTGRYLSLMLANSGFKVGHFSSPHIFSFYERFAIYENAKPIGNIKELLENAHQKLQKMLEKQEEELSYFEYLCFLAPLVFIDCDYVILEAGLGGEYDATSVFKKDLCVFTPIDIDHQDILGNSLREITSTKIKAMGKINIFYNDNLQIKKAVEKKQVKAIFYKENLAKLCENKAAFLKRNFTLAQLAYFELIGHFYIEKPILLDLKARCEWLMPNLLVDVGHNELAAKNLLEELANISKIILITNFFANKNAEKIIEILKPKIQYLHILDYESPRKLATLDSICDKLNIPFTHEKAKLKNTDTYVVFGSFLLVENFLRDFYASKTL